MSGERSALAAARRAVRELADPAPRLFADLAASERLPALGSELSLLAVDPFGGLSLAPGAGRPFARPPGGARTPAVVPAAHRRRRRRYPPARAAAGRAQAGGPAPGGAAGGASAAAPAPSTGPAARATGLPSPPGPPVAAGQEMPVFALGRLPTTAARSAPSAAGRLEAAAGGAPIFAAADRAGRVGRAPDGDAPTSLAPPDAVELAEGEPGADTEPTFQLLDRLARSILERGRRDEERRGTAPTRSERSRRLPAPFEAFAPGAAPGGAAAGAPADGHAGSGDYPLRRAPGAAGEATAGVPPRAPDASVAPSPPPPHATAAPGASLGTSAPDAQLAPDDLAAAVNDALVDQARRHGVDLG